MAGSYYTIRKFRVLRNAGNLLAGDLLVSQEGVCYVNLVTVFLPLYSDTSANEDNSFRNHIR